MIKKIGSMCTEIMDKIIIKEDKDRRGREKGEVAKLLEEGIRGSGKEDYKIILDEVEAFKEALKLGKRGDCIIIFYEKLKPLENIISEQNNVSGEGLASV